MITANDIFVIRPTDETATDFIVTIGHNLATEKHFASKENAEKYIEKPEWDTTLALFAEMIDIKSAQLARQEVNMTNNFEDNHKSE